MMRPKRELRRLALNDMPVPRAFLFPLGPGLGVEWFRIRDVLPEFRRGCLIMVRKKVIMR